MTQIALPTQPKFHMHQAARPMLARDADSMYWMSRYVERAEHVARLLLVNSNLLVDVGDLSPALQDKQWNSVLTIMRSAAPASQSNGKSTRAGTLVPRYMTFDPDNHNSLITCVTCCTSSPREATSVAIRALTSPVRKALITRKRAAWS